MVTCLGSRVFNSSSVPSQVNFSFFKPKWLCNSFNVLELIILTLNNELVDGEKITRPSRATE
jgi:hypothetical protein